MQLHRHPVPVLLPDPDHDWEAGSVLNANVWREDDGLMRMFYRATNGTSIAEKGGYVSSIGYAESKDGILFERRAEPLIAPDQPYEIGLGCEDPRVTRIGDEYFIYYTAVEGHWPHIKVRIALATTTDCRTVVKHGIVGPAGTESKAAALLPEPVNGEYIWYYTWRSDYPESTIMHARFADIALLRRPPQGFIARTLEHYDSHAVLSAGRRAGSPGPNLRVARGPELGPPPIKTEAGWLLIYCPPDEEEAAEWQIGAALLDLEQPWKVIARPPKPLLRPETDVELVGVVNRVTFPSGAVVVGDDLYIYYGCGDSGVALATCSLKELLDHLAAFPV